jgi:hypothetical protein
MTTSAPVELHITQRDWNQLRDHLFPGDRDEHGAVLLCGVARSPRGTRLLVREVVIAEDGLDYVPGTRGYRHLTGEFVTHQTRRAREETLVYLAAHNHGGRDSVAFSGPDFASHERGYPTLLGLTRQHVGALVLATQAAAGDIWLLDGSRTELVRLVIVGERRTVLTPQPSRDRRWPLRRGTTARRSCSARWARRSWPGPRLRSWGRAVSACSSCSFSPGSVLGTSS